MLQAKLDDRKPVSRKLRSGNSDGI